MKRTTVFALLLGAVLMCQGCSGSQGTESSASDPAATSAAVTEVTYKQTDSDRFAEELVGRLTEFNDGEIGYSIKVTHCAYDVYVLTNEYDINSADPAAVRASLETAVGRLSDKEKEKMMLNQIQVSELINECTAGEQDVSVFDDVGAADEMKVLLFDVDAHNSWIAFKEIYNSLF